MKKIENINFYEKIPKKYLTKTHNPHYNLHHITVPFRALIVGNSGSMKTNTLLNILHNMPDTFERIVICLKSKDEPLYNYLSDKLKDKIEIVEGISNLPSLDSFSKEVQSLLVFDDLVNEKNQKIIEEAFIRLRKKGASMIYISQSFYAIPKMIRNNVNYIFLKQVSSLKNLTRIMNENALGIDKSIFKQMYDLCTKNRSDFLLIDLDNPDNKMRFRKNLDEQLEFPEQI
jgi:ABC-type dipeptide/oligopeptide/nickel transport system ATPase component